MKITIELKADGKSAVTFNVFKRTSKKTEQLIGTHRYGRKASKHTFTELGSEDLDKYQRVITEDQMFDVFAETKGLVNNYLIRGNYNGC